MKSRNVFICTRLNETPSTCHYWIECNQPHECVECSWWEWDEHKILANFFGMWVGDSHLCNWMWISLAIEWRYCECYSLKLFYLVRNVWIWLVWGKSLPAHFSPSNWNCRCFTAIYLRDGRIVTLVNKMFYCMRCTNSVFLYTVIH